MSKASPNEIIAKIKDMVNEIGGLRTAPLDGAPDNTNINAAVVLKKIEFFDFVKDLIGVTC